VAFTNVWGIIYSQALQSAASAGNNEIARILLLSGVEVSESVGNAVALSRPQYPKAMAQLPSCYLTAGPVDREANSNAIVGQSIAARHLKLKSPLTAEPLYSQLATFLLTNFSHLFGVIFYFHRSFFEKSLTVISSFFFACYMCWNLLA
jgi:hypothetical protein